jgi:predicted Zn-dependent peptidase
MSSRLFQRIREDLGLVYTIYSFHEAYEDTGVLGVFFGTEPRQLEKALSQVFSELRKLLQGEITPQELDFAKSYIKGNVLLGMENTGNRMGQLARSEIYTGCTEGLDKTIEKINRVSLEDIRRVGGKYLTDRNLAVAAAVPASPLLRKAVERSRFI